jgi:hypothetical protein
VVLANGIEGDGASGHAPDHLPKLYIYSYSNRVRSSLRLEAEFHRNNEGIWLLRSLQSWNWHHQTKGAGTDMLGLHQRATHRLYRVDAFNALGNGRCLRTPAIEMGDGKRLVSTTRPRPRAPDRQDCAARPATALVAPGKAVPSALRKGGRTSAA